MQKELVEKDFMSKLSDLSPETQTIIKKAEFNHYNPWRVVNKEDLLSTPVRINVDLTCTGFNLILAKGENRMSSIFDLIVRNRCRQIAWSSDISKLYNHLHLNSEALPFSLFLFNESLDPDIEPEVWVMTRAWYGITSTGNQAAHAIKLLVDAGAEKNTEAAEILTSDIYVDDLFGGGDSEETVEDQIQGSHSILSLGEFCLKCVAKSREKPPYKASSDGISVW